MNLSETLAKLDYQAAIARLLKMEEESARMNSRQLVKYIDYLYNQRGQVFSNETKYLVYGTPMSAKSRRDLKQIDKLLDMCFRLLSSMPSYVSEMVLHVRKNRVRTLAYEVLPYAPPPILRKLINDFDTKRSLKAQIRIAKILVYSEDAETIAWCQNQFKDALGNKKYELAGYFINSLDLSGKTATLLLSTNRALFLQSENAAMWIMRSQRIYLGLFKEKSLNNSLFSLLDTHGYWAYKPKQLSNLFHKLIQDDSVNQNPRLYRSIFRAIENLPHKEEEYFLQACLRKAESISMKNRLRHRLSSKYGRNGNELSQRIHKAYGNG